LALTLSLLVGGTAHWTCQIPIERLHVFYFSVVNQSISEHIFIVLCYYFVGVWKIYWLAVQANGRKQATTTCWNSLKWPEQGHQNNSLGGRPANQRLPQTVTSWAYFIVVNRNTSEK
jgi:hypothetical protein